MSDALMWCITTHDLQPVTQAQLDRLLNGWGEVTWYERRGDQLVTVTARRGLASEDAR